MRPTKLKRTVLAVIMAAATAVAGAAGEARAFSFDNGDLVLAIYGNNTEALINLGQTSTLFAGTNPINFDVSAALALAQVGTNAVSYTLFQHDFTNFLIHAATGANPSTINPNLLGPNVQFAASIGMSSLGGFTGDTIAKADSKSFSSNLNQDGAGNFGGTWPTAMQGSLGQLVSILSADVNTNALSQVSTALLAGNGMLTLNVAAVPLPAAVVLFGSGLVGLIGIARRSRFPQTA